MEGKNAVSVYTLGAVSVKLAYTGISMTVGILEIDYLRGILCEVRGQAGGNRVSFPISSPLPPLNFIYTEVVYIAVALAWDLWADRRNL